MPYPHNDHGFHIPQPIARPGEKVDFSHLVIPAAGAVSRPPVDIAADDMREHAYALVRVLDEDGAAVGPWDPGLSPEALKRGLRAMMLTRAYDARMVRVQRQGKTSFYMKCTGEEAVAVAAAMALEPGDMCFPTYRQQGLLVARDWPLADLMTDKATVEMTAPVGGKVTAINGAVGDQIAIGSVLAEFEIEDGVAERLAIEGVMRDELVPDPVEVEDRLSPTPVMANGIDVAKAVGEPAPIPTSLGMNKAGGEKVHASPAVRARAKDLGIDLAQVRAAESGRIRHADLDAFLTYNRGNGYRPAGTARADEHIRVIGMRRRIAENMAASKRAIPHFTYVEEIDVTKLEALRADLNATRGTKPKLTLLPLLIAAICQAIPAFPMINARYDDEAGIVTRSGAIHLGMATQTDAGLMVPVIRNAESRNIWQLAAEIARLADAARSGKAKSEELSGSTLTVTSLGPLGGIATTPVINRPEVAIIGPNKMVERPIFRDGQVIPAKLMNLSISCDHRVVDGWDAASFIQALKRLMETPALLFADMPA